MISKKAKKTHFVIGATFPLSAPNSPGAKSPKMAVKTLYLDMFQVVPVSTQLEQNKI